MSAVVKKPANTRKPWVVRYKVDGRQREKSFARKKEADDFKVKVDHDQRAQVFVDPDDKTTLAQYADKWLAGHAVSAGSRRTYASVWANNVRPVLGHKRLATITREDVTDLLLKMSDRPAVARTARSLLSAMLSEATAARRIAANPARSIRLPAAKTHRAEFYMASLAELNALAAGLPEEWRPAVALMRGCGLRIGEALAVEHECVRGKTLRVSRQRMQDGSYGPLKGRRVGQYRDVPLPSWVAGQIPDGSGPLFPEGRTDVFRVRFERAAKAAGMPDGYHPHDLRHSFASHLLASGVPLFEVSRFLGHKSADFTAEVYGHLVPEAASRAAEALEGEWAA